MSKKEQILFIYRILTNCGLSLLIMSSLSFAIEAISDNNPIAFLAFTLLLFTSFYLLVRRYIRGLGPLLFSLFLLICLLPTTFFFLYKRDTHQFYIDQGLRQYNSSIAAQREAEFGDSNLVRNIIRILPGSIKKMNPQTIINKKLIIDGAFIISAELEESKIHVHGLPPLFYPILTVYSKESASILRLPFLSDRSNTVENILNHRLSTYSELESEKRNPNEHVELGRFRIGSITDFMNFGVKPVSLSIQILTLIPIGLCFVIGIQAKKTTPLIKEFLKSIRS